MSIETDSTVADRLTSPRSSRIHIAGLDGLRGLAALAVFGLHLEHTRARTGLFDRAYMAVDFFFLLSGFVIALAYEPKFRAGLTPSAYARTRFIRLYPMIVAGGAISAVFVVIAGSRSVLWVMVAAQLAFIPFVASSDMFLLNVPQWSLFFEGLVNLVHAATYRFLTTRRLAWIVALSGVWQIVSDLYFGNGGAGLWVSDFGGGVPRVTFSFFAGVLICRLSLQGRLPRIRVPYLIIALGLAIALIAPPWPWLPDWVFPTAIFPVVLFLALGSPPPTRLAKLVAWSGAISYPLYAVHFPLLQIAVHLAPIHLSQWIRVAYWLAVVAAILVAATALERFYDRPTRRWLGNISKRRAIEGAIESPIP